MGECGKEQSFAILDAFYNLGGNFLDTLVARHCLDLVFAGLLIVL